MATVIELRPNSTEDDLQTVIRAVYRQVLGNPHVLESDRQISAESKLRNGEISVRGFVRAVAKSDLYKSLYFETAYQYRFIEMNCKHLLGRPPADQAEISAHVATYSNGGYDADIDSYIDSAEYMSAFGENIVPYSRGNASQVGIPNSSYGRNSALDRGYATSDRKKPARLISALASNAAVAVKAPAQGRGADYDNTTKRYRIKVATSAAAARVNKYSKLEYVVNFSQLNQQVRQIHKSGGKIVSISEVA